MMRPHPFHHHIVAIVFVVLANATGALAATHPIDLSRVANQGLRDEVAGDRRGGWTDQGPANDLSALPPGSLQKNGLGFEVLDATKNEGRACVVLAGPAREYFPRSVLVPVADSTPVARRLYLLHATAWTPSSAELAGVVTVRYRDDTEQRIEVRLHRDVADWWSPARLPNGVPFWSSAGDEGRLGLYASKFALTGAQVKDLRFESSGKAVWGIVAATLSDDDISFPEETKTEIKAGPNWAPLPVLSLDIVKDSVFDSSRLLDAPAGKYGALRATPTGRFEFTDRPGVRVRFWGVNLTFGAMFPDHAAADRLAERLARSGYNTVRFHHYDRDLLRRGGSSHDFDPEKLDRLNYLFAALKKRGLYINLDLYTIRRFGADEIPERGKPVWTEFKGLLPLYDSAFEAWRKFAEALLTRINPYTGLTWAEDPALIGICPVNEDTLVKIVQLHGLEDLYASEFERWIARPENAGAARLERTVAYNRFLVDVQRRSDARLHAYLRSLPVKALLTGANWMTYEETNYLRDAYDYVDLHGYWDHPQWPPGSWGMPVRFNQTSAVEKFASHPRSLMPTRIFGKPFVVTETNYCWPNARRAEGAALLTAYAGLQDWDAIYAFDYSDVTTDTAPNGAFFQIASDPIRLLSDRVGALLFLQNRVLPAETALGIAVHEEKAFSGKKDFPWPFSLLGLVTRIGSFNGDHGVPANLTASVGLDAIVSESPDALAGRTALPVLPADTALVRGLKDANLIAAEATDQALRRFESETGQIRLRGDEGVFTLVTDHAEALVAPVGRDVSGQVASLSASSTYAAIYVVAVDDQPLATSHRLLVLHLTDCLNTGTRFSGANQEVLEAAGTTPHLVRHGAARLALTLPAPEAWRAWAVDATGERIEEVSLSRAGNDAVLALDNVSPTSGPVFAYELARVIK